MKKTIIPSSEMPMFIIVVFPFLALILFSLIDLFTLDDIYLLPHSRNNVSAAVFFFLIQLIAIFILEKLGKIKMGLPKLKLKKIILSFIGIVFLFMLDFVLINEIKENLNYWLRSKSLEKLEIVIVDKHISQGKSTARYIEFQSREGLLESRVSRNNFDLFAIGEVFQVSARKGFFEGYFFSEKLKPINR